MRSKPANLEHAELSEVVPSQVAALELRGWLRLDEEPSLALPDMHGLIPMALPRDQLLGLARCRD